MSHKIGPGFRAIAFAVPFLVSCCLLIGQVALCADGKPFSVHVKDMPLEEVCAILSQASGATVRLGPGVTDRKVGQLDLDDTNLQKALDALCADQKLSVMRGGDKWVLVDTSKWSVEGQIECMLRVLDVGKDDMDALFAAHASPEEHFRLPGGVSCLLAPFDAELKKLLASGGATTINEPRVITADGQQAEVMFRTDIAEDADDVSFPGFRPRGFANSFMVTPRISDKNHVSLALSARTAWSEAGSASRDRADPGTEYSVRVDLPRVVLANSQPLLLRGWIRPSDVAGHAARGRETVVIVSAAPASAKPHGTDAP